jgi:hypothetical protein
VDFSNGFGTNVQVAMQETKSRPQSGILILVASWPSTSKIWSPSSNFSGQSDKNFDLFLKCRTM